MPAVCTDKKMEESADENSLWGYSADKVLSNNILSPAPLSLQVPGSSVRGISSLGKLSVQMSFPDEGEHW